MIATADELTNTRRRHLGVLLSQIHRNLTGLHEIALATLTEHTLLTYAIVVANLIKDIVDSKRMVVDLN